MQKMKKVLALILAMSMLTGMLGTAAFAAEEEETSEILVETVTEETSEVPAEIFEVDEVEAPEEEQNYGIDVQAEEDEEPLADGIDWTAVEITINTLDELKEFAAQVNEGTTFQGKTVTLGADIDLESKEWAPIGSDNKPFLGTFDGNGNTVSNLTVNGGGSDYQGFFGYIKTPATVKGLTVNNASVTGQKCVGALIGDAYTGVVEDCHVTGNIQITGNYDVGGLTGYGYARLTNCSVSGADGSTVTGIWIEGSNTEGDNVGGLIGYRTEGVTMTGCSVENLTVTGTRKVGGLVGSTHGNSNFIDCWAKNVTVGTNATAEYADDNQKTMGIGGLIGLFNSASGGKIENCQVENITLSNPNNVFAKLGYVSGGGRTSAEITAPDMTVTNVTVSGVNTGSNVTVHDPALSGNAVETADTVAEVGGQYFTSLQAAIDAAEDGDTVTLVADETATVVIEVNKSITIEGGNHVVNSTASRILWINNDDVTVTLNDIEFKSDVAERGVQVNVGRTGVELNINNCTIPGTYYAVNMCSNTSVALNIADSTVTGWGALNLWGNNYEVKVANSTLIGHNDKGYSAEGWNGFGVVVLEGDTTGKTDEHVDGCHVVLENCHIIASTEVNADGNGNIQKVILFNAKSTNNAVEIIGDDTVVEYEQGDLTPFCAQNGSENGLVITGGTFTGDVTEYLAEGLEQDETGKVVAKVVVTVTLADATVRVGDTTTLTAVVTGAEDADMTWSSSDETIVTVSGEGVITGVAAGTAIITVDLGNDVTASCTVTVTARPTNTGNTGTGNYNPRPTPTPTPTPTPAPAEEGEEENLEDPDTPLVIRPFLFEDVKESDWFHADVKTLFDKGLIDGVKETVFAPYLASTRAMVATLLYRMAGEPSVADVDVTVPDVKETAWYYNAAIWAYTNGIFGGYKDGSFRGNEVITREQLAAVLSRYAAANGAKLTVSAGLEDFEDADKVSPWALEDMKWAVSTGLIKGRGHKLAAQDTANRAELAALLVRLEALMETQEENGPVG